MSATERTRLRLIQMSFERPSAMLGRGLALSRFGRGSQSISASTRPAPVFGFAVDNTFVLLGTPSRADGLTKADISGPLSRHCGKKLRKNIKVVSAKMFQGFAGTLPSSTSALEESFHAGFRKGPSGC